MSDAAAPVEPSPICDVRATVLRSGLDLEDVDGATETLLVEIQDEAGRIGIGEADTASEAARVIVEMPGAHAWNVGLAHMLIGADPVQLGAIWDRVSAATLFQGAGVTRHALAAVDIALHDLAGKQLGRPVFHLLGGARRQQLEPYATVYAGAAGSRTLESLMAQTCDLLERALARGYRSVKMEVIFGERASDRELVACIREGRRVLGPDVRMLVDFGYRWHDWRDALSVLRRVEDCDLWLAEATLQHSDLDGHARLAGRVETRIGGAELASSREECRAWLERGRVDALQPDVARAGGLTEMRRICDDAADRGVIVVPHCWKTGIAAAASRHLHAATANVPLIETLDPTLWHAPLRADLVEPEPELRDGLLPLPDGPGLGVSLVPETVERYRAP